MKIVVLDDSSTVLLTIQALLEELGVADESIQLFNDGEEALSYISQNGADIIFSDIQMPGMDGFEFVDKLLKLSSHFISTLFIVSADEHFNNINQMKQIGAKRFIRKPINAKHFNHFVAPEIAKCAERKKKVDGSKIPNTEALGSYEELSTPDLSGINYEVLAQEMGIKAKHIPRLIASFISEATAMLATINEAIAAHDYERIEQCAHSIKGSAGNMKFDDIYEMGKVIELAAKTKDETFSYQSYFDAISEAIATIPPPSQP